MRKACAISVSFFCLWWLFRAAAQEKGQQAEPSSPQSHRSPIDIALVGDGRLALVANHTSDSVSLVDIEQGNLLAEKACGRKPVAVAVSRDGKRAAVSNLWSGS